MGHYSIDEGGPQPASAACERSPSAPAHRNDQPSRPKAKTCCLFSSLKTLAIPAEGANPRTGVNVPESVSVGRFSGDHHWPVLGDHWGERAEKSRGPQEQVRATLLFSQAPKVKR
jgi:hypothetical protein